MQRFVKYFLLLSLIFAGSTFYKRDQNPRYSPDVENKIQKIINDLQVKTNTEGVYTGRPLTERMVYYRNPGVSIAVINDDKIEWARGFGIKNENKDPVDVNTLFQAGSVSKAVFALAVMKLKEEGVVDLDKDVNEYLKSWKIPAYKGVQPVVTLRQLLSHTAGFTIHGFAGYEKGQTIPTIEQILNGEPPANNRPIIVNTPPGTLMRYSGGGITVAQLTIIEILNKPFPQIIKEELFDPIGLKFSTYEQNVPDNLQDNYSTGFPKNEEPIRGKYHIYPEMGAAGLWTTPSELAQMLIEVQLALKDESKVFKKETIEEMLTPGKVAQNIGVGFFIESAGDSVRFGHNGWNEGFVAAAVAFEKIGKGAVIMLNSNSGNNMLEEIIRSIAKEYSWPGFGK